MVEVAEKTKPVQFKAKLRFARITPRKLKYVVDLVRGKDYNRAENILRIVSKEVHISSANSLNLQWIMPHQLLEKKI